MKLYISFFVGLFIVFIAALFFVLNYEAPPKFEFTIDDLMPRKIEPFFVEHFEFITSPDTVFVIYANRDIKKSEGQGLHINFNDSIMSGANVVIPIDKDTKNGVINIPFPFKDINELKRRPGFKLEGSYTALIRSHLAEKQKIYWIKISPATIANETAFVWIDGQRITPGYEMFEWFNKGSFIEGEKLDRWGFNGERRVPFISCAMRYNTGQFDSDGLKQGPWRWYYFNGNIMAKAFFRNDSVVDYLNQYRYYGGLQDSTVYEYKDNEVIRTRIKIE